MSINADPNSQPQQSHAEADSLRLNQEELNEASFQATYAALTSLFKTKQKKYRKTIDLVLLEGKISLQAITVMAVLVLFSCIFVATLWCLLNVAIVMAVMHFSSSLWLGLLTAGAINLLTLSVFILFLRRIKREVGFKRTQQVLTGDS